MHIYIHTNKKYLTLSKLLLSREAFWNKLIIGFPFIIKVWDRDSGIPSCLTSLSPSSDRYKGNKSIQCNLKQTHCLL